MLDIIDVVFMSYHIIYLFMITITYIIIVMIEDIDLDAFKSL